MVKFFLRLLIVVFLMESTWAVAAQYCPHELGIKSCSLEQSGQKLDSVKNQSDSSVIGVDHSNADADNDCSYCHLGAMKSMVSTVSLTSAVAEGPVILTIVYSYPDVTPRHPERPNWTAAV